MITCTPCSISFRCENRFLEKEYAALLHRDMLSWWQLQKPSLKIDVKTWSLIIGFLSCCSVNLHMKDKIRQCSARATALVRPEASCALPKYQPICEARRPLTSSYYAQVASSLRFCGGIQRIFEKAIVVAQSSDLTGCFDNDHEHSLSTNNWPALYVMW